MHDEELAIVKALVPVAWADGTFEAREQEMIDALLDAYGATDDEKAHVRAYAAERRALEDIDLQELSFGDRRLLLQHAVVLTYADGVQATSEAAILGRLAAYLRIPEDEARDVVATAEIHAKKHLGSLG